VFVVMIVEGTGSVCCDDSRRDGQRWAQPNNLLGDVMIVEGTGSGAAR